MKKNAVLIVASLAAVLVIGVLAAPRLLRKIRNTIQPIPTTGVVSNKYTPSSETVSGNIALTISNPISGSTTSTPDIEVAGKTTPDADVFVNDMETKADANGNFSIKITLDEGENTITVTANDAEGNYIERDITVTYEVPVQ